MSPALPLVNLFSEVAVEAASLCYMGDCAHHNRIVLQGFLLRSLPRSLICNDF